MQEDGDTQRQSGTADISFGTVRNRILDALTFPSSSSLSLKMGQYLLRKEGPKGGEKFQKSKMCERS